MRWIACSFLLLLAACAGNPPPEPPPVPKEPITFEVPDPLVVEAQQAGKVFCFRFLGADAILLYANGEVEVSEEVELSEAALSFWRAVAKAYRDAIDEICREHP